MTESAPPISDIEGRIDSEAAMAPVAWGRAGAEAVEADWGVGVADEGNSNENEFDWPLPVGAPLFVVASADTVNFVPAE